MKKYIVFLSALLAVGVLTSCEDFLDSKSLTAKSTENFPYTEAEANQLITGIYAHLLFEDPELSSALFTAQLASDDCLGGNLHDSRNIAANFMLLETSSGLRLDRYRDLWVRCYRMINRANVAIETLDNVHKWSSESERNRHFGEAHFLRAFAYYELAQMFGGVPLRLESANTANIPRASIDEVYEAIASDLKKAIELMPPRIYQGTSMMGHATKYAAQALMARVFLFYTGRYAKTELPGGITKQQVIAWIDDCVNNSGHALVSDQRNLWGYSNAVTQNTKEGFKYNYAVNNHLNWEGLGTIETLFANQHKLKGNDWGLQLWTSNKLNLFYSPSSDSYTQKQSYPFGAGWGAGPVSPAMVEDWKAWSAQQTYLNGFTADPRMTGSIWSYRAYDSNDNSKLIFDRRLTPDEPDYTVSYRYYEMTGYQQKKYISIVAQDYNADGAVTFYPFGVLLYPDMLSVDRTSRSLNDITDVIHIRFADVLLMQSELKEDATGLNRVRARSNLAPVGYSLEAIKNERRWEFAFESLRWFDLLRWSGPSLEEAGNALNKQQGFTVINASVETPMVQFDYKARLQKTQGYWPLPQTEIDRSEGVITQNPGWEGADDLFISWNNFK